MFPHVYLLRSGTTATSLTNTNRCKVLHRNARTYILLNSLNSRLLQQRSPLSCCLMSPYRSIFSFFLSPCHHPLHNRPHQSLSYCEATHICVGPILSYLIRPSQELTSSLVSCWIGTPSISRPVHTLLWSTVFGWLKNDLICVWEWQGNCPHTPPWLCDPLNPRALGDTHI